jgi:hypothetical protein
MSEQREMFDDPEDKSFRDRAVAVLGEEALEKLLDAGMLVVDAEGLARFEREKDARVERMIKLAKAAMDAAQSRAMILEVRHVRGEGLALLLCDPSGDEEAMAKKIAGALKLVTDKTPDRDRKAARAGRRRES